MVDFAAGPGRPCIGLRKAVPGLRSSPLGLLRRLMVDLINEQSCYFAFFSPMFLNCFHLMNESNVVQCFVMNEIQHSFQNVLKDSIG